MIMDREYNSLGIWITPAFGPGVVQSEYKWFKPCYMVVWSVKYLGSDDIVKLQYNKIASGLFQDFDNFAVLKHVTNYVGADVRYVK